MKSNATSDAKSSSQETKQLVQSNKETSVPRTSWSHRLTAKKPADHIKNKKQDDRLKDDNESKVMAQAAQSSSTKVIKEKKQVTRLAAKHEDKIPITSSVIQPDGMAMKSKGTKAKGVTPKDVKTGENVEEIKVNEVKGKQLNLKNEESLKVKSVEESAAVKKPAWLKKLEELKMKNLNEMKTS